MLRHKNTATVGDQHATRAEVTDTPKLINHLINYKHKSEYPVNKPCYRECRCPNDVETELIRDDVADVSQFADGQVAPNRWSEPIRM